MKCNVSDGLLFLLLYAFRLGNVHMCRTFYQVLEHDQIAHLHVSAPPQPDEFWQTLEVAHRWATGYGYLTWEWRPENALRSPLAPLVYLPAYLLANRYDSEGTRRLHIFFPKIMQAGVAALTDFYTYRLGVRLLGPHRGTVVLTCCLLSLMSAIVLVRPFSNSIETAFTAVALAKWPWNGQTTGSLPTCLAFAAMACIIRPPNIIIWILLALTQIRQAPDGKRFTFFWALFTHALPISIGAAFYSFALDSFFYRRKTWTPLNFLRANVLQNISIYYGTNNWSYYLVQGVPALAGVFLPEFLRASWRPGGGLSEQKALRSIWIVIVGTMLLYSCLEHKEIRFVMPLLPLINVLAARGVRGGRLSLVRLALAAIPTLYLLVWHMSGQLVILNTIRSLPVGELRSVAFLAPCHSTPWQSHLALPHLDGPTAGQGGRLWFLTCEPPLGQNVSTYVDQSDVFYANPSKYLEERFPTSVDPSFPPSPSSAPGLWRHEWPSHLVVFEALMRDHDTVSRILAARGYVERDRLWNSHVHEDHRRSGDILLLEWRPR